MYLGHDAEFAVIGKNGKAISAHHFFPPKDKPLYTGYTVASDVHRDCIFRDGTSLEVNTPGGIQCIAYVLESTKASLRQAERKLPEGARLEAVSAYEIEEDLSTAPQDVLQSGCSPVRNAYEGGAERAVFMEPRSKMRFAGGHIHLSSYSMEAWLKKSDLDYCAWIVQHLDMYLAVPILSLGIEGDLGKLRRKVFGKAGEFRLQAYKGGVHGIEYRVLGPEWLRDGGLAALVLMLARSVARMALNSYSRETPALFTKRTLKEVAEAINLGEADRIMQSPAYLKGLQKVLAKDGVRAPRRDTRNRGLRVQHLEFIRDSRPDGLRSLHMQKFTGEYHTNWPECMDEWGWKE